MKRTRKKLKIGDVIYIVSYGSSDDESIDYLYVVTRVTPEYIHYRPIFADPDQPSLTVDTDFCHIKYVKRATILQLCVLRQTLDNIINEQVKRMST